ncbi:MAG: hypothetical protein ABS55_06220 [Lautropia sp. SCN 70-15]|nr:MAG: hypothetical protein ABS55_06220 [Lautropia sp. SCN 70-15]
MQSRRRQCALGVAAVHGLGLQEGAIGTHRGIQVRHTDRHVKHTRHAVFVAPARAVRYTQETRCEVAAQERKNVLHGPAQLPANFLPIRLDSRTRHGLPILLCLRDDGSKIHSAQREVDHTFASVKQPFVPLLSCRRLQPFDQLEIGAVLEVHECVMRWGVGVATSGRYRESEFFVVPYRGAEVFYGDHEMIELQWRCHQCFLQG